MTKAHRFDAAHLLAIAASNGGTLREIAAELGTHYTYAGPVLLARAALVASLGCGNWRDVRAEAEAKLRTGWSPR